MNMMKEEAERHIKILGILNIVWGAMTAFGGLILLAIFGGVFGVLGLAHRAPHADWLGLPVVGIIGGALSLFLLLISAPSIIAGIGLLYFKPWARILAIIMSALHLPNLPFGTALGIYGLWILLSQKGINCFENSLNQIHRQSVSGSAF
jgi:hypothetical protein